MGSETLDLSSWKEIASYLGVGVRTAQEWERMRGLPIHRLPGGRGRVMASAGEIEAWKNSSPREDPGGASDTGHSPPANMPATPSHRWFKPWVWLSAIAIVLTLGAFFLWPRPGPPARFRVDHNTLIISDDNGRELWKKRFASLADSEYKTDRFVWFGQLNGEPVVLFVPTPATTGPDSPPLLCYSRSGHELWRFVPGRTVNSATSSFPPPYYIRRFGVAPLGKERNTRIVLVSNHHLYFPSQVALLSSTGVLIREYWHSGQFGSLLLTEYAGRTKVLLGGTNNSKKMATLVALDPDAMAGASAEDDAAHQLQGFAPGSEEVRLLFPRACFNRLLGPFSSISSMDLETGGIAMCVQQRPGTAALYYHLKPDLTFREMLVGSSFEEVHSSLFATHVLDHRLSDAESAELEHIQYLKPPHLQ